MGAECQRDLEGDGLEMVQSSAIKSSQKWPLVGYNEVSFIEPQVFHC